MWNGRHEWLKYVAGYKDEGRKSGVRLYTGHRGEETGKRQMTETLPPGFRRQVSEDVYPETKDEGRAGCDNITGTRRSDQKRQMTETLHKGFRRRVSPYPEPKGGGRESGTPTERTSYGECLVHLDQLYLRISGCFEALADILPGDFWANLRTKINKKMFNPLLSPRSIYNEFLFDRI